MSDLYKRLEKLVDKIELFQRNQQVMQQQLHQLMQELQSLKNEVNAVEAKVEAPQQTSFEADLTERIKHIEAKEQQPVTAQEQVIARPLVKKASSHYLGINEKVEDFIGTNLISKIGILITIIGVFIGVKYAIDKDLVSPAVRVTFGYLSGAALIFAALRLKAKYQNFSAVLMGGGLAVLYFITYVAYGFYQLFPQSLSFLLMLVITGAAVSMALWYNEKVIALLGQVGAYAIPFLLSNSSGKVVVLFTYISVINIGLLILSFSKNWKILYRIAFLLTWFIYFAWYISNTSSRRPIDTGLIFLSINFLTFYATFLSYKIVKRELYNIGEVAILLVNALVFFFLGIALISDHYNSNHYLTYFTLANALVHFVVGFFVYRLQLADKSVYQFLLGLGLLFITIAIPIELDGSYVTALWAVEATVLCWIGCTNKRALYLTIAIPMIVIAVGSLVQDWFAFYSAADFTGFVSNINLKTPLLHVTFWLSLFVSACLGYISWLYIKYKVPAAAFVTFFFRRLMPAVFVVVLFFNLANELAYVWDYKLNYLPRHSNWIFVYKYYQTLSLYIFTFLYSALMMQVNARFIKGKLAKHVLEGIAILVLIIFLMEGLNIVGNLREYYISTPGLHNGWLIAVRYLCFIAVFLLLASWRSALLLEGRRIVDEKLFVLTFNLVLLSFICNEFIQWMDMYGYKNQYKLGLSIITAMYAMCLVAFGIKMREKYIRISAIVLFGITLVKLFAYDLSSLSTISKTIVLVVLGIILLIISFLYNKYKHIILGDDMKEDGVADKRVAS